MSTMTLLSVDYLTSAYEVLSISTLEDMRLDLVSRGELLFAEELRLRNLRGTLPEQFDSISQDESLNEIAEPLLEAIYAANKAHNETEHAIIMRSRRMKAIDRCLVRANQMVDDITELL